MNYMPLSVTAALYCSSTYPTACCTLSPAGGIDFIGSHVVGQFDALSPDLDKCFPVNVLSDSLVEGEESFTVSLHLLTNLPPSLADRISVNENQMKVNIIDTSMLKIS